MLVLWKEGWTDICLTVFPGLPDLYKMMKFPRSLICEDANPEALVHHKKLPYIVADQRNEVGYSKECPTARAQFPEENKC